MLLVLVLSAVMVWTPPPGDFDSLPTRSGFEEQECIFLTMDLKRYVKLLPNYGLNNYTYFLSYHIKELMRYIHILLIMND